MTVSVYVLKQSKVSNVSHKSLRTGIALNPHIYRCKSQRLITRWEERPRCRRPNQRIGHAPQAEGSRTLGRADHRDVPLPDSDIPVDGRCRPLVTPVLYVSLPGCNN